MCELSIIIVNWNSWPFLKECLDSIAAAPPAFPFEIIVVDNASGDGSVESLRSGFPAVRLIENTANLGFAAANNRGAQQATGRVLLFLNPDTLVHPGTLAGAVAFMAEHPEAGVMGCRTVNPDGSLQATVFGFPGKLRIFAYVAGLNRVFKLSRFTDHSVLRIADFVQGSFLVIKKELFDERGGFDERFFFYAEEVDLCLRIKAAGFTIYYYPGISITHHGGGSSADSVAALGHYIRSILCLYQKYRPAGEVRSVRRVLRCALRWRFFSEALFSPGSFRKRKKALADVRRHLLDSDDECHFENES